MAAPRLKSVTGALQSSPDLLQPSPSDSSAKPSQEEETGTGTEGGEAREEEGEGGEGESRLDSSLKDKLKGALKIAAGTLTRNDEKIEEGIALVAPHGVSENK